MVQLAATSCWLSRFALHRIATKDMVTLIRNFFRASKKSQLPAFPAGKPAIPSGERIYAIGDIHGRLDLLNVVADAIEADDLARGAADTTIVLLGDLVDRGPDSAGVIEMVRQWSRRRKVRIISGNHEEIFLHSFHKLGTFRSFLKFGGRETILSYGVDREAFLAASLEKAQQLMIEAVPREDRDFILGFEKLIAFGDYLFVHAGIDPDTPLEKQTGQDCRWIREPFLSHDGWLGKIVVHGHTVTEEADVRNNRIGIDTGAFMSGRLTALGLEGTQRWLIQSEQTGTAIETFARAA